VLNGIIHRADEMRIGAVRCKRILRERHPAGASAGRRFQPRRGAESAPYLFKGRDGIDRATRPFAAAVPTVANRQMHRHPAGANESEVTCSTKATSVRPTHPAGLSRNT